MTVLLLLQLVLALRSDLTPGAMTPILKGVVCATPWTADRSSDVPASIWQNVLTRYGVAWTDRFDYLPTLAIPKSLGGVYAIENVYPAAKNTDWNQARKQQLEHRLYDELCAGRIHLSEAQQKASGDWYTSWRIYFAP